MSKSEPRKQYPASFKVAVIDEWKAGASSHEVIKKHKLWDSALYAWNSKIDKLRADAAKEAANGKTAGASAVKALPAVVARPGKLGRIAPNGKKHGRYPAEQKARVIPLLIKPDADMAALAKETGIHAGTLYAWRKEATERRAVTAEPVQVAEVRTVADMQADLLRGIRTKEGLTNMEKAVKEIGIAYRAGDLPRLDEFHLRFMLGYELMTVPRRR